MSEELLKQFEDWGKQQGKSENTIKTYQGVLKVFSQWLVERNSSLSKLQPKDIQAYMDYLDQEQQRSASTIDKVFATIRVFAHFSDQPEIVENIRKKEKQSNIYQSTPESLDEPQKNQLLKSVKTDGNKRNIAIVYTLLYTGIRISELCNVEISDIEIRGHKGTLTVRDNIGNAQRVIPLSKETIDHLSRYISSLNKTEGILFISNNNKPLNIRTIQNILKAYHVNSNLLRHTYCQDLINHGMDPSVVAQLAGFQDLNMVKRYQNSQQKLKSDSEQSLAK